MATAKRSTLGKRTLWPRALLAVLLLGGALAWFYREPIAGKAEAGAAFGARTACSCRYVAGRDLKSCEKDFEPGMALVSLSDDAEDKAVTARVPLLSSATARYREGFGCVLEPWEE
jgi:hypothetical protein